MTVEFLEDRTLLTAAVWTDLPDYGAGDTAIISGREFGAAENVRVRIVQDGTTEVGNYLAATDALGGFQSTWTVCDCAGAALSLTATGLTSGLTASTNFTDSPKIGSVSVGAQTGTLTFGTAGSATYSVTIGRGTSLGTSFDAALTVSGLPSGVTGSFSSSTVHFNSGDSSKTVTLTLSTTATTPATSDSFSVKATVTTASSDNKTGNGTVTINKANTTTTILTDLPDPTVVGQPYTVTYTVVSSTSGTPSGNVTVSDGTDSNTCTVAAGSCTLTSSTAGAKTITATYAGNSNFNGSTSAGKSHTVNAASTSTALASSDASAVFGQSVTFTATVTANSPSTATPSGTVAFKDGGTVISGCGSVALNPSGRATCTTLSLSVASHTISATFSDGANFTGSSASLTQTVSPANTTTTVTSSDSTSNFGQSVTFTATIDAVSSSAVPTGTVQFKDGSTVISGCSSVTVNSSGKATCITSSLTVGSHTITAIFTDGTNFNGSSGSRTQSVVAANTTTTITSNLGTHPNTVFGQPVTFTATVKTSSPGHGNPTGTVQFKDCSIFGCPVLATVTLTADGPDTSLASFTTSTLAVNAPADHDIFAFFTDGTNFNSSSSPDDVDVTVSKASTTTTISSSANPSVFGQSVTFTATVSPVAPSGDTINIGTVTFTDGSTTLCSAVAVIGGSATCTTSSLSVGSHTIKATYSDGPSYNGSASANLTQTVNPASTSTAVSSSLNPSTYGQSVSFTATVSVVSPGAGTVTGAVQFLIDGVNFGSPVAVSGGTATSGSTSTLSAGSHTVTAVFTDGTNFLGSTGTLSGGQTVNKAHLTVTANNASRTYGDANPAFSATLSGFVNGETLATSGVTGSASCSSAATPTSSVAGSPYTISCTQGTLAAGNYDFPTYVDGALTVLKAHLTVTADNQMRFYGDPNPTLTAALSGFKNGETLATSGVTGSASCTTAATPTSPVSGSPYSISCTQGTLAAGNYDFPTYVDGALTILKAHLTVTADNQTRVYGVANPALTATLSGFKNGETLATSGVTGSASCTTAATPSSSVGTYTISCTQGSLAAGNYDFTPFIDGTLTVTKRTTATAVSFAANPINEGSSTAVTVTVTDTNGAALVNVDPSGSVSLTAMGTITLGGASCTLVPNGSGAASCSVTVTGVDNPGGSVSASFAGDSIHFGSSSAAAALTVNNVAPTLGALTITGAGTTAPNPMLVGTTVTAGASYTDPGVNDTQSCYYTWDDGSTSTVAGSAAGSGSCSTTHTYSTPGVYQVTLTVTDKDGGVSNTQVFQYVIIYDPNGGFITGGGWTNPMATTRANFGFNAKYLSSGALQGQSEFNYQAGNINFHGTASTYLVITTSNRAQYVATGTVNGVAGYSALVTAWDDSTTTGCTGDRYRIKITNGSTVVFDNGSGSDDIDACPPAIANGSIVVHSGALTAPGGQGGDQGEALTAEQLAPVVAAARARWEAAGISAAQRELLQQTPVRLVSLPGEMVGWTTDGAILINPQAPGGWFIDPTPGDDAEFGLAGSPAQGRMDLLSVVAHEMGHVLGLEHSHDGGIMDGELTAGVRHVPGAVQAPPATIAVGDPAVSLRLLDALPAAVSSVEIPAGDQLSSQAGTPAASDLLPASASDAAPPAAWTRLAREEVLDHLFADVLTLLRYE